MSSTLLDEPQTVTRTEAASRAALRRRTTMAAVRLSFTWFGVRKSLNREQKELAADTFAASADFVSAGKKLLDTRDRRFQAVTAIRTRAVQYWKAMSLPFPEPGLRLIRQEDVDAFNAHMVDLKEELEDAVASLDNHFDDLKQAARRRLGSLFAESDYPATLRGLFGMEWEFPSAEPPNYLRQLSPAIYEEECERVRGRFQEAVRLAEEAFLAEFEQLVAHLCDRLSGETDGQPKVFRNSAVDNLRDFFERFRNLNVGSDAELDRLVEQAQNAVQGVLPQQLRDSQSLRQHVAGQMAAVQANLDQFLVDRPRRNILRKR